MRAITTQSGSTYEADEDNQRVRRLPDGDDINNKRGDSEWLHYMVPLPRHSLVGSSAVFWLEPLAAYDPDDEGIQDPDAETTVRTTSTVIHDTFDHKEA